MKLTPEGVRRVTDKFEDIKVGDVVYLRTSARGIGWSCDGPSFWLPRTVDKVTPRRFNADGQAYLKMDGCEYGGYARAHKLGDEVVRSFYSNSAPAVVVDQTAEHKAYAYLVVTLRAVRDACEKHLLPENWTKEDADRVLDLLVKNGADK